jgi:hypothetical protein
MTLPGGHMHSSIVPKMNFKPILSPKFAVYFYFGGIVLNLFFTA